MSRKPKFKARDLELVNLTHYVTRDLRALLLAGIRANGCTGPKRIEVKYTRHHQHWGCATLGRTVEVSAERSDVVVPQLRRVTLEGRHVLLTVPKDPRALDLKEFAQVLIHELDHTLGFNHGDMQHWSTIEVPWITGLSINVKPTKPKPPAEERRAALVAKREAHARVMVERWERKAATAKRQLAKWTARVRGYERRKAAKT